jgi:hypothetical protein
LGLGSERTGQGDEYGGHPPTKTGPHGDAPQGLGLVHVALPPSGRPRPELSTDGPARFTDTWVPQA